MTTLPADTAALDRAGLMGFFRDLVELGKPRLAALVIFTFGGALLLAPQTVSLSRGLTALIGTTLIVAAANAINMYLERDIDGLMRRTQGRPLPQGRISPIIALATGAMLGSAALPLLFVGGGFLVVALGLIAFYAYVWGYTPLKRRSPISLYVGAVPGAMPPLMGWATASGTIDAGGLALFMILFVWQVPHFIAIAIFRAEDYAGAGFRVISLARSPRSTRATMIVGAAALVPLTLALYALGIAGWVYAALAIALGLGFVGVVLRGVRLSPADPACNRWARVVFFYSILYLTALFFALALDHALLG